MNRCVGCMYVSVLPCSSLSDVLVVVWCASSVVVMVSMGISSLGVNSKPVSKVDDCWMLFVVETAVEIVGFSVVGGSESVIVGIAVVSATGVFVGDVMGDAVIGEAVIGEAVIGDGVVGTGVLGDGEGAVGQGVLGEAVGSLVGDVVGARHSTVVVASPFDWVSRSK